MIGKTESAATSATPHAAAMGPWLEQKWLDSSLYRRNAMLGWDFNLIIALIPGYLNCRRESWSLLVKASKSVLLLSRQSVVCDKIRGGPTQNYIRHHQIFPSPVIASLKPGTVRSARSVIPSAQVFATPTVSQRPGLPLFGHTSIP